MTEQKDMVLVGGRMTKVSTSLREMAKAAKNRPVLVLDASGSMSDPVQSWQEGQDSRKTKIEELRELVRKLRLEADFDQLVFHSEASFTEVICDPTGGTALHKALELCIAERTGAKRFVLITDGYPDSRPAALECAKRLPAPLDVFYVGPESDEGAKQFLKELAASVGGEFGAMKIDSPELEKKIRKALNPAPKGIAL